jgi:hypothetical protein
MRECDAFESYIDSERDTEPHSIVQLCGNDRVWSKKPSEIYALAHCSLLVKQDPAFTC